MRPTYAFLPLVLSLAACGAATVTSGSTDISAAADRPSAQEKAGAEQMCMDRRSFVLSNTQQALTPNAIRWSCSDAPGVNANNKDDRGQEYCEYFAIVKLPSDAASTTYGKVNADGSPQGLQAMPLTADQKDAIDDLGAAEVGKCVFTSWHADVAGPVPSCKSPDTCPKIYDKPIDQSFRMVFSFNTNGAASSLVRDCMDPKDSKAGITPDSTITDTFMRGCMLDYGLYGTEWRKSDPTICTAAMRLTECGCDVGSATDPASAIADALVPPQPDASLDGTPDADKVTLRGFPLGTWSGASDLPAGCSYVDIGNESTGQPSQTIVQCSITAADLLTNANDLKNLCRTKYGDDVVVQIPIPAAQVSCTPPAGAMCAAQPWVVSM